MFFLYIYLSTNIILYISIGMYHIQVEVRNGVAMVLAMIYILMDLMVPIYGLVVDPV